MVVVVSTIELLAEAEAVERRGWVSSEEEEEETAVGGRGGGAEVEISRRVESMV